MLLGYLGETKAKKTWFDGRKEVTNVKKYDDHDRTKKGDISVTYGGREFFIEVKSLQTNSIRCVDKVMCGKAQVDASDRRPVKLFDGSVVETTCLLVGEFDILAVNLFSFGEGWRFIFAKNKDLPRSKSKKYTPEQQQHLLATTVNVSWPPEPPFTTDPYPLLDELLRGR